MHICTKYVSMLKPLDEVCTDDVHDGQSKIVWVLWHLCQMSSTQIHVYTNLYFIALDNFELITDID